MHIICQQTLIDSTILAIRVGDGCVTVLILSCKWYMSVTLVDLCTHQVEGLSVYWPIAENSVCGQHVTVCSWRQVC
jgi:hypothetical protein